MNDIDRFFQPDPAAFASAYLEHVQRTLQRIDVNAVGRFLQALIDARERGASVYFIGNGGSAATASHFANDLAIGVNDYEKPIRAFSLTDNHALISAIGNDFGFEEVFVRQLRALAKPGDLVVAISASGNSPNLVKAAEYAREARLVTVALTAFDGGRLARVADVSVHVPTGPGEYGPAEDAHMVLDHLVGNFLLRYVRLART